MSPFASASGASSPDYVSEIHFAIRTGIWNGNAVLLVRAEGPSLMYDSGDLGFGETLPGILDSLGITQINVMLSHCHGDHAGGLLSLLVLRPEMVQVILYPRGEDIPNCILLPLRRGELGPAKFPIEVYEQALQANKDKFLPLTAQSQTRVHQYLGDAVSVVRPDYSPHRTPRVSLNDRSLTACVTWPNGVTSLLIGDNNARAMESLIRKPVFVDCLRKADFYLANHHGLKYDNTRGLLARQRTLRRGRPLRLVIVSSQGQNPKGDASAERIRKALNGEEALRTAYGDIRIDCPSAYDPCAVMQTP